MPARLNRRTFTVSRDREYFDARELQAQTGQERGRFAAVILKELVDNALDAAETAEVAPEVAIDVAAVDGDLRIRVADNGPGMPPDVVARILDFSTRTSDKAAYRAPTRGLQGNALKTVVGIPTALGGGAPIVIDSKGRRHEIRPRLDPAGHAEVEHRVAERLGDVGTTVTVALPADGQDLDALRWARGFALANPHASVKIRVSGDGGKVAQSALGETDDFYRTTVAYPGGWRKFLPTDPTSPHWYDAAALTALVFNHVAAHRRGEAPDLLLRDFVQQFRGLTGSAKAKAVCDRLPSIRRLSDFAANEDAVAALLAAMQDEAAKAKPNVLGCVGEAHVRACFDRWYGVVGDRFWYAKREGMIDDRVPFVVEAALAETERPDHLFAAVNFSPTFDDPLRGTRLASPDGAVAGAGVRGFLAAAHALPWWYEGDATSVAWLHVVCPSLTFLDRGKSQLRPAPHLAHEASAALWRVAKTLHAEGERREKDAAKQERRERAARESAAREARARRWTLKDAVFAVIPEAYAFATGGGARPVGARGLMYQIRPRIQRYTDKPLDDDYCTQTLIPEFERLHGELPRLYYEPRGTLYQPHQGSPVPLGTREVAAYDVPRWTYDKILFVEKTGLYPVLADAQLAERYDMAIIASNGFGSVACRRLLERASREHGCRLFVLHDADDAGYNIARTVAEETRCMPNHRVDVVDLGLSFEAGLALGIAPEQYTRTRALPVGLEPTLTDRERKAFGGRQVGRKSWVCERIELNALSSPQLVEYVEAGLARHWATAKIVPPDARLEAEATTSADAVLRSMARREIEHRLNIDALVDRFVGGDLATKLARDAAAGASGDAVRERLDAARWLWWKAVASDIAETTVRAAEGDVVAAIEAMLAGDE